MDNVHYKFLKFTKFQIVVVICFFPSPGCAPFPPCSPLTFVNKLIESNNFSSDLHPYYPIPPCQYQGGTLEALAKNDLDAVFIEDIPRHIMYEATWVAGTGIPRLRFLQEIMMLTLLYTGYKMLGFTRGGPPLETSKNEATEACEGSN